MRTLPVMPGFSLISLQGKAEYAADALVTIL